MHPDMNLELARVHRAEIRWQVDQARAARVMLAPSRPPRRIALGKFRYEALIAIFGRGWRAA